MGFFVRTLFLWYNKQPMFGGSSLLWNISLFQVVWRNEPVLGNACWLAAWPSLRVAACGCVNCMSVSRSVGYVCFMSGKTCLNMGSWGIGVRVW